MKNLKVKDDLYLNWRKDFEESGFALENINAGPLLPGEGRKIYPKGKAPKKTNAKLPVLKSNFDMGDENIIENKKDKKDPCWKGYTQVGMKMKNGKEVPNCVPSKGVKKAKGYKKESINYQIPNIDEESKKDHEYQMARSELSKISSAAKRLGKKVKGEGNLKAWVQSKITRAADYIDTAADYVDSQEMNSEGRQYKTFSQFIEEAYDNVYEELIDENIIDTVKNFIGLAKDRDRKVSEKTPMGKVVTGLQKRRQETDKYLKMLKNDYQMEDWQKVNRKDETDGLSQKAVNAYRRENPGSKLQTAVTEKKPKGKRAKRRKSFCRRMKGMKSKLTSSKTARDPDSRINKALRRWRCS